MEININCRLFFKQNSLTLFHCSLMFKAKCEYWARFTISYVDFVTYIISREVTLKSIEPDRGIRGRWALIADCAQPACASAQSGHGLFCVQRGALGCNVVVMIRPRRLVWVCTGRSNDFYMLRPIDFS